MRADVSAATKAVKLAVRRGSIFGPLILLLVTIFLFVVYALPSEYGDLGRRLGLTNTNPTASEIISQMGKVFSEDNAAQRHKFWEGLENRPRKIFSDVIRPMLKVYLEQLATDFRSIAKNAVLTILTLGLYALVPGIAGLIYPPQLHVLVPGRLRHAVCH